MNQVGAVGLPFLPLLFAFVAAAAVASYLLRKWSRTVGLAGAGAALLLALFVWLLDLSLPIWVLPVGGNVDLGAPITLAGFSLQLTADNAPVIAAYLMIAALALLLGALHRHDALFPAQVWVIVGGYTALALLVGAPTAPVNVAPVLLILLTALSVYVLHGNPPQSSRSRDVSGALRVLLPPVLAATLYLIGGWWVEQIPLNPQDLTITQTAGTLMGLGVLLLLAPFPLHGVWPATSESAPPAATLLVSLFYQLAVLFLAAQTLAAYPFILRQSDWVVWLGALGLLTAVWGGVAAIGANHAGRLWGYAALHDWGLIILALATPDLRGWTLVLFLFALRTVSMITAAVGLSAIKQQTGSLEMEQLRAVGLRMPWNSAALLLGGLGLVGFPLTAGFAGHWAALQSLAVVDWRPAMAIAVASVGAILAFVRLARLMFGIQEARSTARESALNIGVAVSALVITLFVATTPQLFSTLIARALAAFG